MQLNVALTRSGLPTLLVLMCLTLASSIVRAGENPFVDLVDIQGEAIDVGSSIGEGKWTLVMLWTTDCHICTEQKPKISAFYDKHKDDSVNVFGIAMDGRKNLKAVNRYLEKHNPSFPNFVGELDLVAFNYQMMTEEPLRGTPTYLLFNPAGELKGNNPGPVSPDAIEKFIARHSE